MKPIDYIGSVAVMIKTGASEECVHTEGSDEE